MASTRIVMVSIEPKVKLARLVAAVIPAAVNLRRSKLRNSIDSYLDGLLDCQEILIAAITNH